MVYVSQPPTAGYKAGDRTMGGSFRPGGERGYGALRAIDATTGEREVGAAPRSPSWAGVLSTAGGVVFSGTNEGDLVAADSRTGKELWRYQLGHPLYAGAGHVHARQPPVPRRRRRHDADGVRLPR